MTHIHIWNLKLQSYIISFAQLEASVMISKLALYGHIYKIQRTAVLKNFAHVAVFLWEILEGHTVRCKAIFPNFNSCSIEVWEWISNFIPHFIMSVITYQCWDYSYTMFVKGTPEIQLSLKSQDFLVTIYQGMLLWWPFLGLFNWNPLIYSSHSSEDRVPDLPWIAVT